MFVQVIQARATDAAGLRKQRDRWEQELRPKAKGFLGSTGGVTSDGEYIVIARFESEEAARSNSDSAEQGAWWEETSQYLSDPMFHDCTEVDMVIDGGSDDAGFVQVIQGKVTDVEKMRELDKRMEPRLKELRPDVIGGLTAWHPQNGRFTNVIYFRSEAEARAKEKEMESVEGFQEYMEEMQALSDGEPKFLDLSEPWMTSK
ncbi:MAG: hypothetical protein QOH26_92 [Actinomycetota bacterium]|jgi:hypothetical protein|nr:hypothetical protein [Actinomycetota bacterium]